MIEETLRFIESEEVRNYLREFLKTFGGITEERKRVGHRRRLCSSIVCFAPAPIEQKIPVLNLISAQTESYPEGDYCDPSKFAKEYRMALEERYNNPPGTAFRLRLCHYNESGYHGWSNALFTEFDAAIRCIKEHSQTDSPHNIYHFPDACGFLSYTIDKCIPGENGMIEEYCTWILNASGEIWYFDYGEHFKPEDWVDMIDYGRRSVEFPVPFQPGDIVTIDCCPFVDNEHVLIIGYDGFESHLAPMECLYMPPPGKILYTGSINDNAFLTESPVSGYYRIARHRGALRPYEAPLAVISAAAKSNPKLPEEISDYIQEHKNEANGIEWERIRQEFCDLLP